jgi:hypothetical protein
MNGIRGGPFTLSPEGPKSAEICGDEPFGSGGESKRKIFLDARR